MRTSVRSSRAGPGNSHQRGVTLIELLIALSILSMGVLVAATAMNAALPQRTVHNAAEQLVADLKRARLHAQKSGDAVSVDFDGAGYQVAALELNRIAPRGVDIELNVATADSIIFSRGFAGLGGAVTLSKSGARAVILVHPITGKIARAE